MGEWYIVVKTIKGRQYRYRQRTWREGKHVRTESHSLGPVAPARDRPSGTADSSNGDPLADLVSEMFQKLCEPYTTNLYPHWNTKAQNGRIRRIHALDKVISACDVKLYLGPNQACYNVGYDTVTVPPQRCFEACGGTSREARYYGTLFHEIAHWTGHQSRTDRFARGGNLCLLAHYAREELVAEATAVIVLAHLEQAPTDYSQHALYFQKWLNRTAGSLEENIAYAQREARIAADFILSRVNTTKAED